MSWFARMLFQERRSTERQRAPHLAAYYWNGAHGVPHSVRDMSSSGIYLLTEERWHPGTLLMLTLQKKDADGGPGRSIRVQSKVIRWGGDGVGLKFLFPSKDSAVANGTDRKALIEFAQSKSTG